LKSFYDISERSRNKLENGVDDLEKSVKFEHRRELVFAMLSNNGEINELDPLNSSTRQRLAQNSLEKSPCPA